jgi:transcriptional regulator with XRE-family HTH domain
MDMDIKFLRIKDERIKRGWNQTEVAYLARMSPADLSRIETGRMVPYPAHAKRLSEVFGLEPGVLFAEVFDD